MNWDASAATDASVVDAGDEVDAGFGDSLDAGFDAGPIDPGVRDAGPLPCAPPERAVRLDGGIVCFSSREVTQVVLEPFKGALNLPQVLGQPSADQMVLFISSDLDGGSVLQSYVLAAQYKDGTLKFLEPLSASDQGVVFVNGKGTLCRGSNVTGETTLYFRDGGTVAMRGFVGDCVAVTNTYWMGVGSTGYSIARMGESSWQRVAGYVGDVVGVDDNGVVVLTRRTDAGYSEVVTSLRDGGAFPLTATGGPAFMGPSAVATRGLVAGIIDYSGYFDYVVWRLDGSSPEPIIRIRSRLAGNVQGVSGQGDFCGRFFGGRRGYVAPVGQSTLIDPDKEFPELNNLECAGVLGDGAFMYQSYKGDPRRFVIATVRVGPSN